MKDISVLEEHPSMTLLVQLEASLCSLMVTEEKVFSMSEGQVASEDPSSTDPENVRYTEYYKSFLGTFKSLDKQNNRVLHPKRK